MAKFNVIEKNEVHFVEILMENESVRTESGAMRYALGNLEMESQGSGGVGGLFKAFTTGETFFKPVWKGSGKLVLEHSFQEFFTIDLKDRENYIVDQGSYWASDIGVEVSAHQNPALKGIFSGEGWFQTLVKGPGTVVIRSPGPIELVELNNNKLIVDGSFAVARSEGIQFSVAKATKSWIGSLTSGEGFVNTFSGTGKVYLCPVPNRFTALGWLFKTLIPRGG